MSVQYPFNVLSLGRKQAGRLQENKTLRLYVPMPKRICKPTPGALTVGTSWRPSMGSDIVPETSFHDVLAMIGKNALMVNATM